jgi:hypothetical protein
MRFLLIEGPPVLTLEGKLGNGRNPSDREDFIYEGLNDLIGKFRQF